MTVKVCNSSVICATDRDGKQSERRIRYACLVCCLPGFLVKYCHVGREDGEEGLGLTFVSSVSAATQP